MEEKINRLYVGNDYSYCMRCIKWAVALESFRPSMLSTLTKIVLDTKSPEIREEGSSLFEFIGSTSTHENYKEYVPNLQSMKDEEEGEGYWSTFCKVMDQSIEASPRSSLGKHKKKRQEMMKTNANVVLRYYVSLMKKHAKVADLLTGLGTIEHHEHFLTFLDSLKKISAQDLDGSMHLGSVFEVLTLFIAKFDCFIDEFVDEMANYLRDLPFVTQMSFIQYCADEPWKLRLVDTLFCAHADRELVPIAKANERWKAYLKMPPSYEKFEHCVLALRPSYSSKDFINWLSFTVTTYAKLLCENTEVPPPALKDRAKAYVSDIFGWWKEINADEDEIDGAIPHAALVILPILPSLI